MKLFTYIKESFGEVRHIKWPTRQDTIMYTIAVIIIAFAVAYYISFFDILFARLLDLIIS